MKVLVTGGAGFIGSHTVDLLVREGYNVRILDNLDPQVHGSNRKIPTYLSDHIRRKSIEFIRGDILDRTVVKKCLKGIEAVIHLAAAVGVGQSMYTPHYYTNTNIDGTALLLETILQEEPPLKRFMVASSMSIYGEGSYRCRSCLGVEPLPRSEGQMKKKKWDLICRKCKGDMTPIPTREDKFLEPTSVYALTKKMQEDMAILFGATYDIPTFALRYFNVYGPRQSLNNPYTGVIAIFLSRLLNRRNPLVFEDGLQSRDFIHVQDIARSNMLALKSQCSRQYAMNIGTGSRTTILEVAQALATSLGVNIKPKTLGRFRAGDVRHCFGDPSLAKNIVDFHAQISLDEGVNELVALSSKERPSDRIERAIRELKQKALVK